MHRERMWWVGLLTVVLATDQGSESRIVEIDQGTLKGYKSTDGDFFMFYSIPYATAPTGRDRFKAPLPPSNWTGVKEALDENVICPQFSFYPEAKQGIVKEDCLLADVYVPNTDETNLPVFVLFHGGGFQIGHTKLMTPKALVNKGKFIAVTFNSRVGAHGYLCLGTDAVPGNAGLKDQLALLQWVNRNIARFGGNPNDITIAGYSSGSVVVELLLLHQPSRNLFHKIIADTGVAISPWSIQLDPIQNAKYLAKLMNFTGENVAELEDFFLNVPIESTPQIAFFRMPDSSFVMSPCIERTDLKTTPFLTEAPIDILKRGDHKHVPKLVGFSTLEGTSRVILYPGWKDKVDHDFSYFVPADLTFENNEQKEELVKSIKTFYFNDKPITTDDMVNYTNYFTDVMYLYQFVKATQLNAKAGNKDIYFYEFNYHDNTLRDQALYNLREAYHTEYLLILEVNGELEDDSKLDPEHLAVKSLTQDIWINFIKTGKPVPKITDTYPKGWPAISEELSPYMFITLPPQLKEQSFINERMKFWQNVYDKYYKTPVAPVV